MNKNEEKTQFTVSDEQSRVERAVVLARQIHEGHKRLSGETFADHTIRVFDRLKKFGIAEENTLIAAILHHSLDYSNETAEEIKNQFGEDVLELVKNLKKLSGIRITTNTPNSLNEKYVIQTYVNLAKDIRTLVIRLADRTDNLDTSFTLPKEKRYEMAQKALHIYSPLARLIGMSKVATELENNAFKIIDPGEYFRLERFLNKRKEPIFDTIDQTKKFLTEILKESGIKAKIEHRIKHLYGIYRKVTYKMSLGKNPGKNFENIYDIVAMRILVNSIEECYITENILKEAMSDLQTEHADYIRQPRKTGYKSIHNVFNVAKGLNMEIQIKTHEMHLVNEYGPASHLLYKIGDKDRSSMAVNEFREYLEENPNWFKEINYWEKNKTSQDFKPATPFSNRVYAFTPKGDIIELPKGANILDFAYAVHTKVGHSCIGGLVNGQMVKLNYEIQNGDIVEIKTLKSKTKPAEDWLDIVKTKRARDHIKHALKPQAIKSKRA